MKNQIATLLILCVTAFFGCKNPATINQNEAGSVITKYLQANPEYKTARFNYGELKFNSKNEMIRLKDYKDLASEGLISMELQQQKKKFLSKDSSYVYLVTLTEKAGNLVLKQGDNKATVKVVEYVLSDEKPVNFEQVNSKTSKVTVTLKKVNTAFAPFQDNKDANSAFLTKTYKLKLDKEEGWKVVN